MSRKCEICGSKIKGKNPLSPKKILSNNEFTRFSKVAKRTVCVECKTQLLYLQLS
jgi:ribosomal protein L28